MEEEKLAILEKTGDADVKDLVAQVRQWQELGRQVRVAACGPYHSMASRFVELETIIKRLADAPGLERARLAAKMRDDYPQNKHALEWADWIERESLIVRCSECARELTSLPNALCPNVIHWRAWAEWIEAAVNEANEILMDTSANDIEHHIECHADTLPLAFRTVATGADKACDVLQRVIRARLPE